jgi:hypothetical protein
VIVVIVVRFLRVRRVKGR